MIEQPTTAAASAPAISDTPATIKVIISGGFAAVYREVLPEFERSTGIRVETGSGASEGTGPKTIRHQLANGIKADVVILSREGLRKLNEDGRIRAGSEAGLATAPLAAAVRAGSPKPDIGNAIALTKALIDAGQIVAPSSTSGQYFRDKVFPKLNLPASVRLTLEARGTEAAEALRAGKANLSIGPTSELVQEPGIELVGLLPPDLQLVQTFTAAVVSDSKAAEAARRLIDFLSSDTEILLAAIKRAGMERP
ncbi:substrate-binding domain-containing protein [Bradyrhizobium septentrionale]|uniref:Substrate-binding domain-containing protein n=1 Tax=Bradyrhizobium septentrionale TaxID=1404411 RepID=A0A973W4Z1_9BRAD|nr:substrate-binding domain-containing protein [Bradyrhizobium septentrionale]UGY16402.1 substrate-binding domain-containing protein [Bradyrhizobium septentrionale]UGY25063.1 substrate-binding domain-containing protein [Bradyrhizobium septentrionale]